MFWLPDDKKFGPAGADGLDPSQSDLSRPHFPLTNPAIS
jgi:hypothetical protein